MFSQFWENHHMNKILVVVAMMSAFACTAANAATLSSSRNANAHALYLDGGADVFDTVEVLITPTAPTTFVGATSGLNAGVPRPAGEAFTYLNRKLNGDPLDDPTNLGWSVLGLTNTAASFGFTGGPLGQTIVTNGPLFLANLNMSSPDGSAVANVKTYRLGAVVADQNITLGAAVIPEPASLAMAGMGIVGMVAVSRRRKA
jgi:hypothetical protein